jgi:hypothetical protein
MRRGTAQGIVNPSELITNGNAPTSILSYLGVQDNTTQPQNLNFSYHRLLYSQAFRIPADDSILFHSLSFLFFLGFFWNSNKVKWELLAS